jgi:hypothetical protein
MALNAGRQRWFARIRSILAEKMAVLAAHARLFLVEGVVVVDGLVMGRIKNLWEYKPTDKKCSSEAYYKEKPAE